MGLKTGCAALAAQKKLFVLLNTADGHPYLLAQVEMSPKGEFQLVYPDGRRGVLRRRQDSQLVLVKVIPKRPDWQPSEDHELAKLECLPREKIIFNGEYVTGNRPDSDFPPPPIHVNDEERFKDPHGPWEEIVAQYLRREPVSVFP